MDSTGSESGPGVGSSEHGSQPLVPYNKDHFLTRLLISFPGRALFYRYHVTLEKNHSETQLQTMHIRHYTLYT
jgi:hypothetical protein